MDWGRKWTNHEILLVTQLRQSGRGFDEIAERLGRSRVSVRSFLNRNHITVNAATRHRTMVEASVKREINKRKHKNYTPSYRPADFIGHVTKVDVPLHVIADRDRRADERAQMSAAQLLLGEPTPSQSALARPPRGGLIERRESVTD